MNKPFEITYHVQALFWSNVNKSAGCWTWTRSKFENGYGRFYFENKSYKAHRISYFLSHGEIPNNLLVCHSCDNKECVNPKHLFLATCKENIQDMYKKGRENRYRGKNKGVSYRKETEKWRARYMINYKSILVGEFDTKEEALAALKISRKHL